MYIEFALALAYTSIHSLMCKSATGMAQDQIGFSKKGFIARMHVGPVNGRGEKRRHLTLSSSSERAAAGLYHPKRSALREKPEPLHSASGQDKQLLYLLT